MDKSFNMDKIYFTFNTFFYDFLKDIKSACKETHPDIRKSIRGNYVVKDNASEEHCNDISNMIDDDMIKKLLSDGNIFDVCSNVEFFKGHMLKTYANDIKSSYIEGYLYIFVLFIHLKRNPIESDTLFELVMKTLGSIQKGIDPSQFIDEIVDDEIVKLLLIIKRVLPVTQANDKKTLENTKIGKIAEEIAQELDLDGMNLKSPGDILQGNGDLLGKIVSNVSSKLQKKFADGSINQNELLSEAMSVIGGMKDGNGSFNNIFSNMMKSFGAASGSPHSSSHVTSRLRNKLKQKKDKM